MRAWVLLLAAGCASESHGGGPPPAQYDDLYVRHPKDLTSVGPVTLDATTPMLAVHLRSSLALTTSNIYPTNENVNLQVHLDYTRARIRVSVYPDGGSPSMLPGKTIELGGPGAVGNNFDYDQYLDTFENCDTPCVRTEDYWYEVELLEGASTTLSWYAHNAVRLQEPYGEHVPAADETFTIDVVP
jgi:hypothetical protein